MNSSYAYTPSIWPSIITVVFLITLSFYGWRRRSEPGAFPFSFAALLAAFWAAGSVMEIAAEEIAAKIFWYKFEALLLAPLACAITCFVLEYTWPGRWLTRRNLALLSVPPLLEIIAITTNDFTHLAWSSLTFDGMILQQYAPFSLIIVAYGYGLAILNVIVFIWLFLHSPQHRWPVVVMLTGLVVGRSIFLLQRFRFVQADLPIVIYGMAFEFLMYAIALFAFRLLDPILLARQAAIEQMRAGMLVLDPQGKIVSLNPAASAILGLRENKLLGRLIQELLSIWDDLERDLRETGFAQTETSLPGASSKIKTGSVQEGVKTKVNTSFYQVEASGLNDWRGKSAGYLLLLHNVTEQKYAQAQFVEQQRALATLKEREQVARELHDELSQELAYINVQTQLICSLLEDDRTEPARKQLQLLAKVARDTQIDVRGQIRKLSLSVSPDEDFPEVLRRFLDMFQQMYTIETELILPEDKTRLSFSPTVNLQVLRIVQETFTNIRKHSCAQRVRVSLARDQTGISLTVEDNGIGFNPAEMVGSSGTFGLHIMAERAREIGGNFQVSTQCGSGTRISVQVPSEILQVQ